MLSDTITFLVPLHPRLTSLNNYNGIPSFGVSDSSSLYTPNPILTHNVVHAQRAGAVLQQPGVDTVFMELVSARYDPQMLKFNCKCYGKIKQNKANRRTQTCDQHNLLSTCPSWNSSRQMAQTGLELELLAEPHAGRWCWELEQPWEL